MAAYGLDYSFAPDMSSIFLALDTNFSLPVPDAALNFAPHGPPGDVATDFGEPFNYKQPSYSGSQTMPNGGKLPPFTPETFGAFLLELSKESTEPTSPPVVPRPTCSKHSPIGPAGDTATDFRESFNYKQPSHSGSQTMPNGGKLPPFTPETFGAFLLELSKESTTGTGDVATKCQESSIYEQPDPSGIQTVSGGGQLPPLASETFGAFLSEISKESAISKEPTNTTGSLSSFTYVELEQAPTASVMYHDNVGGRHPSTPQPKGNSRVLPHDASATLVKRKVSGRGRAASGRVGAAPHTKSKRIRSMDMIYFCAACDKDYTRCGNLGAHLRRGRGPCGVLVLDYICQTYRPQNEDEGEIDTWEKVRRYKILRKFGRKKDGLRFRFMRCHNPLWRG